MATVDPYQAGLAALAEIDSDLSGAENQDTTRFRAIDRLLVDVLGHTRASITTEESVHPGFADYIVRSPEPHIVIEAKRVGAAFELPIGLEGRTTVGLKTLREDPTARLAIDQVLGYAKDMGIPIAGIANGRQLAVFLGSRSDGKRPEDGEAIVFVSIDEMRKRFRTLWDMLSRAATGQRALLQVLQMGNVAPPPPQKLSEALLHYPGFRMRSARETDLRLLSSLFVQDIEGSNDVSDEFLQSCYVESGALSQYSFVSKEILRSRYEDVPSSMLVETSPVRDNHGISTTLLNGLTQRAVDSKPIVVLGDVGVGKTMFIRHLIRIDARDELQKSIVFYIDFASQPALEADLSGHIINSILDQLDSLYGIDINENSFVRATYNRELNSLSKGIYGPLRESDPARYVDIELAELSISFLIAPNILNGL